MNRRSGTFVTLQVCGYLACGPVDACEDPHKHLRDDDEPYLTSQVLRFDVIDIPAAGTVEGLEGLAEVLIAPVGWIALKNGARLGDGARLRICASAKLVVRFSQTERIEFHPAPTERWVQLQEILVK
jgi:hypothetical protein